MREYEVHLAPSAIAQITEATRYVRDELCMPQAAANLLGELEAKISGLSRMPFRFRTVDVEPLLLAGIRRMNVRKYSVYYVIDDEKPIVSVFAVLYGTPSDCRLQKVFEESNQ